MIIFATCHDDSTKISFAIAKAIATEGDIFLEKENANRANLIETLQKNPSLPLMGLGHGENGYWVANNNQPALDITEINSLQNRKIYAYACRTANELGASLSTSAKNCFYWGYNSAISVGDNEFLSIISPIISYIKHHFYSLESVEAIQSFLEELKQKCDSCTEHFNSIWVEDERKFSAILQLTQALRDIWAKLVISFNDTSISHFNAIEASLW